MKTRNLFCHLHDCCAGKASSDACLLHSSSSVSMSFDEDAVIPNAVPLRDFLTGVLNGSPIPADFLGESFTDTDDTPASDVDPHSNFGFDRLAREEYAMEVAATEGNRARTARSRAKGDVSASSVVDATPAASSAPAQPSTTPVQSSE